MSFVNLLRSSIKAWRSLSYSCHLTAPLSPKLSRYSIQQDFLQNQKVLEKILIQNILPFWYPQIIDWEGGGYQLNHNLQGKWKSPANKYLVTQARTVWFFSRLANSSYGTREHLEAAKHGYKFLYEQMWDCQFGGFYWEVDSSGKIATKSDKHLYGQAFGLYALSEYAIASGDSSATALADKLFNLLEDCAHDLPYGGYQEFFQRDWNPVNTNRKSYLGVAPTIKLMNTHLHLLEAITTYYLLTKNPIAQKRLIELILIHSSTFVRKTIGACTDEYQRDWMSLKVISEQRISYGHNLENIWLLIKACNAVGISNNLLLDFYRTLFSYSLQYGFDRKNGGFYHTGFYNTPADKREKIWWVQAEALVSALQMYYLTEEKNYWHCFYQTLNWIFKHQVDWEYGDWHAQLGRNRKPSGDKAGAWKSPYHNGRAMLECLELLLALNNN